MLSPSISGAHARVAEVSRQQPLILFSTEGTLHRAKPSKFESKRSADFWGWCICAVRPM